MPSKISQIGIFWLENVPSGNPVSFVKKAACEKKPTGFS
jgi:hypothetical protein